MNNAITATLFINPAKASILVFCETVAEPLGRAEWKNLCTRAKRLSPNLLLEMIDRYDGRCFLIGRKATSMILPEDFYQLVQVLLEGYRPSFTRTNKINDLSPWARNLAS